MSHAHRRVQGSVLGRHGLTLYEAITQPYLWADSHALIVLAAAVLIPTFGTGAAWIGRGGKTDKDGLFIANALFGFSLFVFSLSSVGAFVATSMLELDLFEGNFLVMVSPLVCLVFTAFGVLRVFPLSRLWSTQVIVDITAVVLACWAISWFVGKFGGWYIRAGGAAPAFGPDPRRLGTNRGGAVEKKPVQVDQGPGGNDACPCGSGKKYNKCHGR